MRKRRLDFNSNIDLRGQRVEEALRNVVEFIDIAIMLNVNQVKILHGKGNGILRQYIREYLQTVELVKSARDEQIELGGSGITIVEF